MRRIGFDAVRALRNSTGLGNYGRRVLQGLLGSQPLVAGKLFSPRPPRPEYAGFPQEVGATLTLPTRGWRGMGLGSLWRSFRLGRAAAAEGIELYHGLSHEIPRDLPRTAVPSVVSFLDLIWRRFPEFYPLVDRRSYEWRYRWSAEHATAIVAASQTTRSDLLELYDVDPDRVVVLPPPRDPAFFVGRSGTERGRVLARHALPERFLLSVGTLEPRKNQHAAIAALADLDPQRTPPLVLVGRDGGSRKSLLRLTEQLGVTERVLIRSRVSHADLPAVMQSAAVFLYPSLYEGFGMPIVEALSAGVPVIASAGGCFPEAGGPETLYAPATDAGKLAELIRRVLDDPPLAERMRAAGRRHAERFDGDRLAAAMLAVYEAVLGGVPLPRDFTVRQNPEESPACAG